MLKEPYGPGARHSRQDRRAGAVHDARAHRQDAGQRAGEGDRGSGPYKFRADLLEPGVKIVLEKFADYKPRSEPPNWASGAKIAKLDRIEMLAFPTCRPRSAP